MRVVYTAGVFDILHSGHIEFLRRAKALGNCLVVGVLTDEGASKYKDKPIRSCADRMKVIEELKCVDIVVTQDNTDPTNTLKKLKKHENSVYFPDVLVRATDVKEPVLGQKFIEKNKRIVMMIPYSTDISSSIIKERIRNDNA